MGDGKAQARNWMVGPYGPTVHASSCRNILLGVLGKLSDVTKSLVRLVRYLKLNRFKLNESTKGSKDEQAV